MIRPRCVAEGNPSAFNCSAIVLFAHNHPSAELKPSEADLRMHNQWTEAGQNLGLRVRDHVIVTRRGYYSFQEAGRISA